jgi:hypothetical protein
MRGRAHTSPPALGGYLSEPRDHTSVLPVWTGDRPHYTFGLILVLGSALVVLEGVPLVLGIVLVVLGVALLLLACM